MTGTELMESTTVVSAARRYPLVEMMATSFRRFYKSSPMIALFESEPEMERKQYLCAVCGASVAVTHGDHGQRIDSAIRTVQTKFALVCDDDVFFRKDGLFDWYALQMNGRNVSVVGTINGYYKAPGCAAASRFDPACLLVNVADFSKCDLTFQRDFTERIPKIDNSLIEYRDTGSYVLSQAIRHRLDYINSSGWTEFATHYGATTIVVMGNSRNVPPPRGDRIARLEMDMFDTEAILNAQRRYLEPTSKNAARWDNSVSKSRLAMLLQFVEDNHSVSSDTV